MARQQLEKFLRSLRSIEHTRKRMELLFGASQIETRDIDSVYEALFLRAVTSFEAFLEDLFLGILERRTRYRGGRVSLRMKATPREAVIEILLQGKEFLTWIPFNHTEARAKLYLKDGKPFTDIGDGDKSTIKTITTIRHAIAHRSKHAVTEFERIVIGSQALLPEERTPAGYLRSRLRSGSTANRFEVYVGELGKVASALC